MRKQFALILLVFTVALGLRAGDKYANLSFVVVKADNGKPVRNAAIVLHPVKKDGKQAYSGLELKTDPEGKASYAGLLAAASDQIQTILSVHSSASGKP